MPRLRDDTKYLTLPTSVKNSFNQTGRTQKTPHSRTGNEGQNIVKVCKMLYSRN